MIRLEDCIFEQVRSSDNEAAFFAVMGRFFASAAVRRECGGYALSDGPLYRWFIVRRRDQTQVLGFISLEQRSDVVRIREGYLRSEARGRGLFRTLRQQALEYIDSLGLDCTTRVPQSSATLLMPHGFQVRSVRGSWVTLVRSAHATSGGVSGASREPVSRTG